MASERQMLLDAWKAWDEHYAARAARSSRWRPRDDNPKFAVRRVNADKAYAATVGTTHVELRQRLAAARRAGVPYEDALR